MWSPELGDVETLVRRALAEDLATTDVTTAATVPADHRARAKMVAKSELVVCGLPVAAVAFAMVGQGPQLQILVPDGSKVAPGTTVATVDGNAREILAAERTALNFVQRLSGTATLTRRFVDATQGRCRIADTRKTTPGLRSLQRYAVRSGGGHNHRNDLGAGVLIKENHIRCAGGVTQAIVAARQHAPHSLRIECEVTTFDEVREAIGAGADAVLLDNMNDAQVEAAVAAVDGRAVVEVSGNVTLERVGILSRLGVDVISVGSLTHSAPAADLSLLVEVD